MSCSGAMAMEQGMPDGSNEFSAEGSCAHFIAAQCLIPVTKNRPALRAEEFVGRSVTCWRTAESGDEQFTETMKKSVMGDESYSEFVFEVDDDMAEHIQTYIDQVLDKIAQYKLRGALSVQLLVEVRVDFSSFVGIPNQFGTSDIILLVAWPNDYDEIHVGDLKFGRGVEVYAEKNKQMQLYALGAYYQFSAVGDYGKFSMSIHQPRRNHHDEWETTLEDIMVFADEAKVAAQRSFQVVELKREGHDIREFLAPTEDGCRFCKAKANCSALREHVAKAVFDQFDALDQDELPGTVVTHDPATLGRAMAATGIIEDWIKAVRAATEAELFAGKDVPGYKLVMGKQGNRKWKSELEAETALKKLRIKQEDMYSFRLLSPTQMEKFFKPTPRRWVKLVGLIDRRPPVPSVAPVGDKRAAIKIENPADGFEVVE
jgi:hypothetical protein